VSFTILPRRDASYNVSSLVITLEEMDIASPLFWSGCDQDSLSFWGVKEQEKDKRKNNRANVMTPLFGSKVRKNG
jgi:hypothetical protein